MAFKLSKAAQTALNSNNGSHLAGPYSPAVNKVADHHIRTIRICLKKDKNLPIHKRALMDMVKLFEKENRYIGHISVNVDPS